MAFSEQPVRIVIEPPGAQRLKKHFEKIKRDPYQFMVSRDLDSLRRYMFQFAGVYYTDFQKHDNEGMFLNKPSSVSEGNDLWTATAKRFFHLEIVFPDDFFYRIMTKEGKMAGLVGIVSMNIHNPSSADGFVNFCSRVRGMGARAYVGGIVYDNSINALIPCKNSQADEFFLRNVPASLQR